MKKHLEYYKYTSPFIEKFTNQNNAICIICYKPNVIWLDFLINFKYYDIYLIIDDNTVNYKFYKTTYPSINFIQIDNNDCENNYFIDVNYVIKKKISGWDKALFYFAIKNNNYKNIWFIEDDVFFYNEQTIIDLDNNYPDGDLLSAKYEEYNGTGYNWRWDEIKVNFDLPYYWAMVCCVRISKVLLSKIQEYASKYKTLFFLEALFPTITKKHNLKYIVPDELETVVWRNNWANEDHCSNKSKFQFDWNQSNINKTNIFHPVKNIDKHIEFRSNI